MKKKLVPFLAVSLFLSVFSTPSFASSSSPMMSAPEKIYTGPDAVENDIGNRNILGLSDGQVQRLRKLRLIFLKKAIPLRGDIKILVMEERELLRSQYFNINSVIALDKNILHDKQMIHDEYTKMLSAANAVLTPKQFRYALSLCSDHP
jgi:hypothetical protein